MGDPLLLDGIPEGAGHVVLADDLAECLGAVLPCQDGVAHGYPVIIEERRLEIWTAKG
jgi:hypothetical protein